MKITERQYWRMSSDPWPEERAERDRYRGLSPVACKGGGYLLPDKVTRDVYMAVHYGTDKFFEIEGGNYA